MVMFGGVGMPPQVAQLRKRIDILVATPGRLLDHVGQRTLDLSGIEILVLDEGDRMLDMGFIHDIRRILALMPRERQSMLFSATFSEEVRALAASLLRNPASVDVAPRNIPCELVQQTVHLVARDDKRDALSHLIRQNAWEQVLVFTRTKHGANRLAEKLEKDGIRAAAIHGNKSQGARTRALEQFKKGEVPVLVATDIAARGLDIEELPHVVNFELPNVAEDYVHRIGRTGRAGSLGAAVSLVDSEEIQLLRAIEKLIKRPIERVQLEGFVSRGPQRSDREDKERDDRASRTRPNQNRSPRNGQAPRSGRQRDDANANRNGRQLHDRGLKRPLRDGAPAERPVVEIDDDARGNRIHAAPPDNAQRNRRQHTGHSDNPRQHTGRSDAQRQHQPKRDDAQRRQHVTDTDDDDRGNRVHHAANPPQRTSAESETDASEAARHQALPQPALFSPKAQPRAARFSSKGQPQSRSFSPKSQRRRG
jgi:ATP-dependent RNA helicase RhlE